MRWHVLGGADASFSKFKRVGQLGHREEKVVGTPNWGCQLGVRDDLNCELANCELAIGQFDPPKSQLSRAKLPKRAADRSLCMPGQMRKPEPNF